MRYSLVQAWLQKYEQKAPWDAAKPGNTCLSVSVHRVFQAEVARANSQCRVTLFLDLTTFYETISHQRLVQSALELEYPATLLNIALQIYRGARVLDGDSGLSPATREEWWQGAPSRLAFQNWRCMGRVLQFKNQVWFPT